MITPLKILHIGKYFAPFVGGIENVTEGLAKSSVEHGHEVTVLCHQHEPRLADCNNTISIHGGAYRVRKCRIIGKLLFTPLAPFFPSALKQELATNPDIVHIHMPNPSAFWLLLHKKKTNERWVIHWHSDVIDEQASWLLKAFYRLYSPFEQKLLRKADQIICTSPDYATYSPALACHHNKISVVPLGIETGCNLMEEIPTDLPDDGSLKLLTVGRLTYYKGHKYLLKALATLVREGLELQWHIVGSGEEESSLKSMARFEGVEDRVSFLGRVTANDLAREFAQCDLFCLPSIERTEAFGVVLLEAMQRAKPCVVTDVPGSGMSYVVQDKQTGRVVKRANVDGLIAVLKELTENREVLSRYGQAGRKRLEKYFNSAVVHQTMLEIYNDLR